MRNVVLIPRLFRSGESNPPFDEMMELCVASFHQFLAGDWHAVFVHSDGDALGMWKKLFAAAHHRWERCLNTLIVGADCLAVAPMEVFGSCDKMRLYWMTDPAMKDDRPYLNGEIVYLPATMAMETWDLGIELMKDLRPDVYDHSQMIWNEMFYSQSPRPVLDPTMNYAPHITANPAPEEDAKIWHFHASRGAEKALEMMKEHRRSCLRHATTA